jgi:hypothetical protein
MYHLEHGYWPEDEPTERRKRKILEAANKILDTPKTEIQ